MRTLRKCLSVILVLVFCLVPVSSLCAQAAVKEDGTVVRDCPEIVVHGFIASRLLYDKDDPSQGAFWDWSDEEIVDFVKSLLPIIAKYFVLNDWDTMAEEIAPLAIEFFDGVFMDPDGTAAGNSGADFTYPPANTIKRDSKLDFHYDWRADPIECAEQLNDFIDYVLQCSGCDQVTLTCHSLGGIVTTSYVTLYGDAKLKSVVYNTTAVFGQSYTGELLSGKMKLSDEGVQMYLEFALDGNDYEAILNGIIKACKDLGILDIICDFGNLALEKLSPVLLPKVVVPLFAGMPSIWAMVKDEDMDASLDYVFNTIYKDDPTDRSGLLEKINNYNTVVRPYKEQTLRKLNDDANFYVFSRYGYSSIPIVPSYDAMSDSVIDTEYSSMGATTAEYGKTLTDEQLAGMDAKYVSPDKTVYAGTCMFPDQTWFFRDFPHSINSPLALMIDTLLYTDFQATVNTYGQYPQFMVYNREAGTVEPDVIQPAAAEPSFLDKVKSFFRNIFDRLNAILQSIRDFITGKK